MRIILENVELHVNPDGRTVTIDTSNAETRIETEPEDYSDIREGDIVEFDCGGRHYGPAPCSIDLAGDFVIGLDEYFLHEYGEPFDSTENLVIHREQRTKEPEESGLYITQSGRVLAKRMKASHVVYPWTPIGENWLDNSEIAEWKQVIDELGESEFPLRKAKAVAE